MKKLLFLVLISPYVLSADNEIFIDQIGATLNLNVEQLGSSNIVGGSASVAGTPTALTLVGVTQTLEINQIGDSNEFLGDIVSDSITGQFVFDGDTNTFDINFDATNTFGADSADVVVDVAGSTNAFALNVGTASLASQLDLDWTIQGDRNSITAAIDVDQSVNFMSLDGDSNTVTFDSDGADTGFFKLEQTGNSRTFNVEQQSLLSPDWLQIDSTGNAGTVCVIQNDAGTAVGC